MAIPIGFQYPDGHAAMPHRKPCGHNNLLTIPVWIPVSKAPDPNFRFRFRIPISGIASDGLAVSLLTATACERFRSGIPASDFNPRPLFRIPIPIRPLKGRLESESEGRGVRVRETCRPRQGWPHVRAAVLALHSGWIEASRRRRMLGASL